LPEIGVALVQDAYQHVHALSPGGGAMPVLVQVHAAVGDAERLRDPVGLLRQEHGSVRAGDHEALAFVAERGGRRVDQGARPDARCRADHAELVTAHPIRARAPRDCVTEVRGETDEQRVARGVAERVVVGLEAVEVEQDQSERMLAVGPLELGFDVEHEPPPVAEPREHVGERLVAAVRQ
jgi:hypothetical protein